MRMIFFRYAEDKKSLPCVIEKIKKNKLTNN
jgi:hypothetical protein